MLFFITITIVFFHSLGNFQQRKIVIMSIFYIYFSGATLPLSTFKLKNKCSYRKIMTVKHLQIVLYVLSTFSSHFVTDLNNIVLNWTGSLFETIRFSSFYMPLCSTTIEIVTVLVVLASLISLDALVFSVIKFNK